MDCNGVDEEGWAEQQRRGWDNWCEGGEEQSYDDVNAFHTQVCYRCGGQGHMAAQCATTSKGKGKGSDKGKGKGDYGDRKGKGKGKGDSALCPECWSYHPGGKAKCWKLHPELAPLKAQ